MKIFLIIIKNLFAIIVTIFIRQINKKSIFTAQTIILFGLLFFSQLGYNQTLTSEIQDELKRKETVDTLKLNEIFTMYKTEQDSIAEVSYKLGINYWGEDYDLTLYFLKKCSQANPKIDTANYVCRSTINIPFLYKSTNKTQEAKQGFRQFLATDCTGDSRVVGLYELGILLEKEDRYFSAIPFLEEIINEHQNTSDDFRMINSYTSLGHIYQNLNKPQKAIEYYSAGILKFHELDYKDANVYRQLLISRAQVFEKSNEYNKAENDYNKAISLTKNNNHEYYYHTLNQKGLLFIKRGEFSKAITLFDEVINDSLVADNIRVYSALSNKAEALYKSNQFSSILSLNDKALKVFFKSFELDFNNKISTDELSKIYKKDILLQLIDNYIQYTPTNLIDDKKIDKLIDLIDLIANESINYSVTNTKLEWRKQIKEAYSAAINYYEKVDNADMVFELIEKSKAFLLLSDIQQNLLLQSDEKGLSLQNQLIKKETELSGGDGKSKTALLLEIEALKEEFTNYKKAKSNLFEIEPLSRIETQARLSQNQMMFDFFWGEEYVFISKVTKRDIQIEKVAINEFETLKEYIVKLQSPYESQSLLQQQNALASTFFSLLVNGNYSNQELIVLPDGLLSFLPFETLMNEDKFLVETNVIDYGYSASTFFFDQKKNASNSVAIFSPIEYESEMKLASLNFSTSETKQLSGYKSSSFEHKNATKAVFMNQLNNHQIIHVSSHGSANDDEFDLPWVAAQNEKIYLPEIYQLNLNANLVVLSACETSLGEQINGEGVMSLARGFTQAGANSVIASLWRVNEKETADLVNNFYKKIKTGSPKATALQGSKIDFIKSNPQLAKSPYYWAGLVYLGQNEPIDIKKKFPFTPFLAGIGIISLCFLLYKKLKN